MEYANILVSADLDAAASDRIAVAAGLARRFGATLTGAAAHRIPVPFLVGDLCDAVDHIEQDAGHVRSLLREARELFARSAGPGVRTAWHASFEDPVAHLLAQACAADLVVVSRRGPDDADPGPLGVSPGPVLMEAGKPLLILPPRLAHLKAGRIVIAWRDAPEARRAVSAALPFIREADHVFVATVGASERPEAVDDVAGHLARHGASVTAHRLCPVDRVTEDILHFARLREADLIVSGAYGRSRLREWLFGGVTRTLLDRAPFASLMCH
jgi:nucleotide-binding universal stress UspA family protein